MKADWQVFLSYARKDVRILDFSGVVALDDSEAGDE
jgi:hypothetical protein